MAKIINVTADTVSIGLDDGSLKDVPRNVFNFEPVIGDQVDYFESADHVVINKVNNVQAQVINNPDAKSKLAAGLLGIFLGELGIHNFYLGFTTKALIQLLVTIIGGVFTLGLASFGMWVWGLVEGIMILSSKPGNKWHQDATGLELND
ncbi:MAG: TM2 domain-containing protein [Coriobacteriales bacterium]|jgi:TM2 domain-containing membrane protein YozV|nr:TM2 domain-containing protein [Coriobacteriales bacterium]